MKKTKALRAIKLVGFNMAFLWATIQVYHSGMRERQKSNFILQQSERIDSLMVAQEVTNRTIANLVAVQNTRSGSLDKMADPVFSKVLADTTFIITFTNKAYSKMMPVGMARFEIFGRTGSHMNAEMAEVWQRNDWTAAYSKDPIDFKEPAYYQGKIVTVKVRKWRDWENVDDVVVYGQVLEIIN